MKYLGVQREKSRKYSQSWQHQHAADELKTISQAANYLAEHGISTLDELDASLSSVSDEAFSIREGMKAAEQRMKELQKLIENGENYLQYKPIHAELKKLKNGWTNKRDKYEETHRAELTLWNAASRYLHANLTDTKTLPISKWKQEYADLKEHPLTGLMYCADCGSKMYVHRVNNGKRVPQYTCSAYSKVPVGTLCQTQHRINADVVMELIKELLKAVAEYSQLNR